MKGSSYVDRLKECVAGKAIPDDMLRLLVERFGRDERVLAVYLLGSAARRTMRHDIDIGVLTAPGEIFSALSLKEEYAADPSPKSCTHVYAIDAEHRTLLPPGGHRRGDTHRGAGSPRHTRNSAIHEYREPDMSGLRVIAAGRWTFFVDFCREIGLTIRP